MLKFTRELTFAASLDAGNGAMRAGGRTTWSEDDQLAACKEFDRLGPLCEHGVERGDCPFCPAI